MHLHCGCLQAPQAHEVLHENECCRQLMQACAPEQLSLAALVIVIVIILHMCDSA